MRKHQTNQNQSTQYKITGLNSFKDIKIKKDWRIVLDERRLMRNENQCIRNPGLDSKLEVLKKSY